MVNVKAITSHRVHPFPARMAASIPWGLLANKGKSLRVLDPMAGSGTSLLVARATGHVATGFDVDPLAVLLAQVACSDVDAGGVLEAARRALTAARRTDLRCRDAYPSNADDETRAFIRYWFDPATRKQLTALAVAIHDCRDSDIRKLLWCGFSRLIITKDAGASLARDVSHSRPHRAFHRAPVRPFDNYLFAVQRVIDACLFRRPSASPTATIKVADARSIPLPAGSVDLVITSPPYLNAIDYMRGHRLSLVWMGHSLARLRRVRARGIGAEVGTHSTAEARKIASVMGRVDDLPRRFQNILARFVSDLDAVVSEIARVLVRGGNVLLVVGDSNLRGIYIRNSAVIRVLAEKYELGLVGVRRRAIPDRYRYLPPPGRLSGVQLAKRMRREVLLTFEK